MSGFGNVYVELDASVVNSGINLMSASGEIPGGDDGTVGLLAWLTWSYDSTGEGGYTGKGWFWDDSNNYLPTAWGTYHPTNYEDTEEGFKRWLVDTQPQNLNDLLGNWNLIQKGQFVNFNMSKLGVYPQDPGGCIEIHP